MDAFEKRMLQKKRRRVHILLLLPVLIGLLTGLLIYTYVFHINQFDLKMELRGDSHVVLEYGQHYQDPGAAAVFLGTHLFRDGVEVEVNRVGSINEGQLGVYELAYEAVHEQWRRKVSRTVEIVDTVEPRIWLMEKPGSYVLPGDTYREEGFMARDNYDGDITDRVKKTVSRDKIIYSVQDSSGNRTQVIRNVVYYDPEPPRIVLKGKQEITLIAGQRYNEPGYSATDNCDGDLTDRVHITGTVNTDRVGTYKLTYTVEDSYGHTDTAVRIVRVKARVKPQQPEVTPSGKVIYLTFDDGPSQHTEKLLKILKKYNVKATFFVMKTSRMDLLDDIVSQGHSIAAHTYSHDYGKIYASDEAYFADLDRILDVIESKTGVKTKLIRFPGGSSNTVSRICEGIMSRLAEEVVSRGFRYFDWNVDSNDAGGAKTAEKVFENVVAGVKNRKVSIVLQHDTKGYSVDAVEKIIVWGLEHGYTFLPLNESSPTAAHDIRN